VSGTVISTILKRTSATRCEDTGLMPGVAYIEGDDLRRAPLRVAASPLLSLLMATRDALRADRSATPESWCAAIRPHLTAKDRDVFAPLAIAERAHVPDTVVPIPDPPGQTLKEGLERILASEDALIRDIDACTTLGRTADWRVPAHDPRRWVRGFVVAMARAWNGFAPIWQEAQDALARESERMEAATANGGQLEALDGRLPIANVRDDRWLLESFDDAESRLRPPERGLLVVPLVAGPRASIVGHDDKMLYVVAYPVRLTNGAFGRAAAMPPASLEALLGIPRARILRELDRPASNAGLAQVLETVPSAASHHVTALEAAGLVVRSRSGRSVTVRRTARGEALLALYDAG
jgi:DNA-binding transcriptional ArsR family regulator